MELHIGELIKQVARNQRVGPTELGEKINTSKQNVYGIFKRKSIDTELLRKISIALDHDFFLHYVRSMPLLHEDDFLFDPDAVSSSLKCQEELKKLKEELENARKEQDYLRKINHLLEENIEHLKNKE